MHLSHAYASYAYVTYISYAIIMAHPRIYARSTVNVFNITSRRKVDD